MEAKRVKLSAEPEGEGEKEEELTSEKLKKAGDEELSQILWKLKKKLSVKQAILKFCEKKENLLPTIMELFTKKANELDNSKDNVAILKNLTCIIANCCNFNVKACLELKRVHYRFGYSAVRILESSNTTVDCKFSLIRLVANLCTHKETALFVSSLLTLVDKLAQFLESDHPLTVKQCLRALSLLSHSFSRVLVQSNTGFYLGKLLMKADYKKFLDDVISLLDKMSRRFVKDTGRQLASSECTERLVSLIFTNGSLVAKKLIVKLCEGSSDIRDRLGEVAIIHRLVEESTKQVQQTHCALLAAFAQDAWGRAALREQGALDLLIGRLQENLEDRDKLAICYSLKHFIHDTNGMAYLARNQMFVDTVIRDVKQFVEQNTEPCVPEDLEGDSLYRDLSPPPSETPRNSLKRQHEEVQMLNFFPSPAQNSSWSSPPYSTPSSGTASPTPLSNSACSTTEETSQLPSGDTPLNSIDSDRLKKHIVDAELWMIAWQAQEDGNIPFLVRTDLLESLLKYLTLTPKANIRVGRALRRMASSRLSIDKLLEMQFHTRIQFTLCDVPCRRKRFAKRCNRCEKCVELGHEILKEFSSHVDSAFGRSFIVNRITSDNFETKALAAIANVSLMNVHEAHTRRRLSNRHHMAVDTLFTSLETILKSGEDDGEKFITYEEGPPMSVAIVMALAKLVSPQKLRDVYDLNSTYKPPMTTTCQLTSSPSDDVTEKLRFELSDGTLLAEIQLEKACDNSEYFRGMFASDFDEKTTKQRVFVVESDKERCSDDDFKLFLHYIAGCRTTCSTPTTASSSAALIHLADRYICTSLVSWLCSPHGPASQLLNGNNLASLLPEVLPIQVPHRFLQACLATLIRFSTFSEMAQVMNCLSHSHLLVDCFLKNFRDFVCE